MSEVLLKLCILSSFLEYFANMKMATLNATAQKRGETCHNKLSNKYWNLHGSASMWLRIKHKR